MIIFMFFSNVKLKYNPNWNNDSVINRNKNIRFIIMYIWVI